MNTGIVFEGGANRTVFTCGVTDALLDNDIFFNYMIGVSAGAAWSISYASKQRGRNMEVANTYFNDTRYMGKRNFLKPHNHSLYGLDFVFDTVPNKLNPFDYDAFRAYKGRYIAVVTNMATAEPEYMDVPRDPSFKNLLEATCALPIIMPAVTIDGIRYMDGGISDSIPFEHALEDGCDKVIVVLTRQADYRKSVESTTKLVTKMYRKYPAFCDAVLTRADRYNACLDRLAAAEKAGKVLVIRPTHTEGISRTEKDLVKLNALYQDGINVTNNMIDKIRDFIAE